MLGEDGDAADVRTLLGRVVEQEATGGDRFAVRITLGIVAGEVDEDVDGVLDDGWVAVVVVDLFVLGDVLFIDEDGAADLEGVCHLLEGCDAGGVQS